MISCLGIKHKDFIPSNGGDINDVSGYYSPLHYFRDKLPKELIELHFHYLGNGGNGADCRIWKKEFEKVVKNVLKIVNGVIFDNNGNDVIIKCGKSFGDEFGGYIMIKATPDNVHLY